MSTGGPVPKNPPVGWVLLDGGYTIRWRRGDTIAVIFSGDQMHQHGMVSQSGWADLTEIHQLGQRWLQQRARSGVA